MVKGFFITGTDTGVGKTIVTASLVAALRMRGVAASAAKPIESGCTHDPASGALLPADGEFLQLASGGMESLDKITPLRFKAPLAPMVAARAEGTEVSIDIALKAVEDLKSIYSTVLVEGIGGLMVPITDSYNVADMALDIGLPLIVVASPFLGTINHTLLTVAHAKSRGLKLAGVILCQHRPPENSQAEQTNPAILAELLDIPLLGSLPHLTDTSLETLARTAEDALDIASLFHL